MCLSVQGFSCEEQEEVTQNKSSWHRQDHSYWETLRAIEESRDKEAEQVIEMVKLGASRSLNIKICTI